ncbi:MAG TPA: hypothetical protein VF813_05390 [Anaerolineaceae bacterium]
MHPEASYQLIAKLDNGEGFVVILYKTLRGQYFSTVRTMPGRTERYQNLTWDRAVETYDQLPIHLMSYDEAFSVPDRV